MSAGALSLVPKTTPTSTAPNLAKLTFRYRDKHLVSSVGGCAVLLRPGERHEPERPQYVETSDGSLSSGKTAKAIGSVLLDWVRAR